MPNITANHAITYTNFCFKDYEVTRNEPREMMHKMNEAD